MDLSNDISASLELNFHRIFVGLKFWLLHQAFEQDMTPSLEIERIKISILTVSNVAVITTFFCLFFFLKFKSFFSHRFQNSTPIEPVLVHTCIQTNTDEVKSSEHSTQEYQ